MTYSGIYAKHDLFNLRFREGHAEIARDGADAELEEEGSEERELGAVEEGDEEQVEQEVREVAAVVEQPRALGQSLGNKFKWFLIRLVFKVIPCSSFFCCIL